METRPNNLTNEQINVILKNNMSMIKNYFNKCIKKHEKDIYSLGLENSDVFQEFLIKIFFSLRDTYNPSLVPVSVFIKFYMAYSFLYCILCIKQNYKFTGKKYTYRSQLPELVKMTDKFFDDRSYESLVGAINSNYVEIDSNNKLFIEHVIDDLINHLDETEYFIFYQFYVEQNSQKDIANLLGKSQGLVSIKLKKINNILKKYDLY